MSNSSEQDERTLRTDIIERPRRNRKSAAIRNFCRETHLSAANLIQPLFVAEGLSGRTEITSMPGQFRLSVDEALKEIEACMKVGVSSFALFPVLPDSKKDSMASEGLKAAGFYPKLLKSIKSRFPESTLMTDIAMDPYSSDGHDGYVENGKILNDATLAILAEMALVQADAGADILGPSDMMDGRVGEIRAALDDHGYHDVSIMSYTAKYASAFYGPFREALDSAPRFGDKKTYQMDPANVREALREGRLDVEEGADFLMVKPALSYLDVIATLAQSFDVPIAAYNVSGEYAMVKAAGQKGWIDEARVIDEILLSMRRAGAQVILTYFAREWASAKRS